MKLYNKKTFNPAFRRSAFALAPLFSVFLFLHPAAAETVEENIPATKTETATPSAGRPEIEQAATPFSISTEASGVNRKAEVFIKDDTGFFINLETAFSIPNNMTDPVNLLYSGDLLLKGIYRFKTFGVFGQIELNGWNVMENESLTYQSALNIGLGGEVYYIDNRLRTALSGGLAVKLTNNELKESGEMGFFIDIRPTGLRFFINDLLTLAVDPIAFNLEVPVLSGIPLIVVEYRTVFIAEFDIVR